MQSWLILAATSLLIAITGCGPASDDGVDHRSAREDRKTPTAGLEIQDERSKASIAFLKCAACHTVDLDGGTKIGPNLANIFNSPAGQVNGYNYSEAMESSQIVWDRPTLMRFLGDPGAELPGTKMVFAGIENGDERSAIVDYLESLTENPK